MKRTHILALTAGIVAAGATAALFLATQTPPDVSPQDVDPAAQPTLARFDAVGPRLVTNETGYPLYVYGSELPEGATLVIESEPPTRLSTTRIHAGLATTFLSPDALPSLESHKHRVRFDVRLETASGERLPGSATLDVVNDRAYPLPYDLELSPDGTRAFVASPTTDEIFVVDGSGVRSIKVDDRPRDMSIWRDSDGKTWLVIVHEYAPSIWLLDAQAPNGESARKIAGPRMAQAAAVRGNTLAVTDRLTDKVTLIDLESGETIGSALAGIDPRAVAFISDKIVATGNIGSSDVTIVKPDGQDLPLSVAPGPDAEIVGGHTAELSAYVMNGKLVRDLAYSPKHDALFGSSIGPNIGPNPDRMEVSMNGGISVYSREGDTWAFTRHVSMLRGAPEGIVLDPEKDLLYGADISTGRVVVFDVPSLLEGASAAKALLGAALVQPPEDTIKLRPLNDYDVNGRPGLEVYSGTRVVRLSADGSRLFALNRLTGTISVFDTSAARTGSLSLLETWGPLPLGTQKQRRTGEMLYFTDVGNSRMSCDTCHYEGHNEGLLFTKGEPMHIYKAPTVRNISETPPYFTPAKFPSVEHIGDIVLSRNRFQNPKSNRAEIRALAEYQKTLVMPPNPYLGSGGVQPSEIALPNGKTGNPARGSETFMARCSSCHVPPMFTTDQAAETMGQLHDVGTPITLSLRDEMQDSAPYPVPVPSLVGIWDNYPLLHSGAGGFSVVNDRVAATDRFPISSVLQMAVDTGKHGNLKELEPSQLNDLTAFLLTL